VINLSVVHRSRRKLSVGTGRMLQIDDAAMSGKVTIADESVAAMLSPTDPSSALSRASTQDMLS